MKGDEWPSVGASPVGERSERPTDDTPRSERAARAWRLNIAAAQAALRAMDPAAPLDAKDTAMAALENAIRDQDEFLHAAAHDLRNPLTALRGQAQLLDRRARRADVTEVDAERVRRGMAAIEDAAERMSRLIERLLDADGVEDEVFGKDGTRAGS